MIEKSGGDSWAENCGVEEVDSSIQPLYEAYQRCLTAKLESNVWDYQTEIFEIYVGIRISGDNMVK